MNPPPPQVPVPPGYQLRDIQLEMSLKPFFDNSPATRSAVIHEVFEQWRALARHAESVSILLWIGDGSEILEYDGVMDRAFEWGRYQGSANPHEWKASSKSNTDGVSSHAWSDKNDPHRNGLHRRSYLYREAPAEFTFEWLAALVADIKRIGGKLLGIPIYVGETFDIGPEFAISRFKYLWHPEILAGGNSLFKGQFISCEAILHADDRAYAAFPQGIPEGTTIGRFLGKQANRFFQDMGFDFLWLSNGFGFALEPWGLVGNLFDGLHFHPEAAAGTRSRILGFWKDLRAEFPVKYPIRTRGTNLCTGIDLGSDASPLREIYDPAFHVEAPVNSPWAALDGDFGIELSGWMSHIARHPGDTFRFRYYLHDPWWKNSPYLDRYERNPHDIFLPSAISRIRSDGSTGIARDIAFLTIDDSDGLMPLAVPNEVTAHLLRAREFAPDDAGPLVWAYPFDAFHDLVEKAGQPEIPFHADTFVGTVINDSVPLNTVMDLRDLPQALQARPDLLSGRIFLSPVPAAGSVEEKTLLSLLRKVGSLLLYGPICGDSPFLGMLGLEVGESLEGDFQLTLHHVPPNEDVESVGRTVRHTNFLSAGGIAEYAASEPAGAHHHLATLQCGDKKRVAATYSKLPCGAQIAWVRGSLATAEFDPGDPFPIRGPILKPMDDSEFFPCGRLTRFCLDAMGWHAAITHRASASRTPYLTIHRHRNAFVYSGYHLDENAELRLRHPLGAPLPTFRSTPVVDGASEISGTRAWSHEVRIFMEAGENGVYRSRFEPPVGFCVYRRLFVSGCRKATLNFLVDPGSALPIRILRDPVFPYLAGDFVNPEVISTPYGPVLRVQNVEGSLLVEW